MAESNPSSSGLFNAPSTSDSRISLSDNAASAVAGGDGDGSYVPRPKRIACVVCRRRKLRCDGKRPSCGTCSRLGHDCAYDEVRKKSGPKRGYVKQLEARLAQVETLLRSQEPETAAAAAAAAAAARTPAPPQENAFNMAMRNESSSGGPQIPALPSDMDDSIPPLTGTFGEPRRTQAYLPGAGFATDNYNWEMISLGLEEPLPTQDVIDELHQIYFEKIHPSIPIIHRPRYLAAMDLAPNQRPPVCLRYIMWCHAACITDKYFFLQEHFYQRARKYAQMDEMRGMGESMISIAYCQSWLLIGTYEFRMLYFPRAWVDVGKAARLALMMGLNRLDGLGLDVKQCIPPPTDWTEREERRRTFWMAFCCDRYASIGTGWPMMIDERDIMTNLPSAEESFNKSKPQRTLRLADLLSGEGTSTLSPFGSVVLLACLFGRNLTHLHRPDPQDNDHDLNGEFWKRHRAYDNILLNVALSLPNHLRLPSGMADPNVIFCNMSIHTSTICLHQAAIFKAEKNKMPSQIITESKRRCIVAADQISSIMKMICHTDLAAMNPFMSFCVYVSARVFVQYLKSRPDDSTVRSSLQFVLSALNALKNKNPLTESFLVQLDVDIEGTGVRAPENPMKSGFGKQNVHHGINFRGPDDVECTPLLTIRQSQSAGVVIESPLQDGAQSSSSNSSNFGSNPQSRTSLPSRQKQPGMQPSNPNSTPGSLDMQGFTASCHQSPGKEPGGSGTVLEMDVSPDQSLSDRNNPPSDHPTPSTLDSSSNTSFSNRKSDQPSPQKMQQRSRVHRTGQVPITSLDGVNPIGLSPDGTDPSISSLADQYFTTGPDASLSATGSGGPFSMPLTWDFAANQASNIENIDMSAGGGNGLGSFNEAQWAQLLNGSGWESWRG